MTEKKTEKLLGAKKLGGKKTVNYPHHWILVCGEELIAEGTERFCKMHFEALPDPLPMRLIEIRREEELIKNIGSTECCTMEDIKC